MSLIIRRATLEDLDDIVDELRIHIDTCKNYYPIPEKQSVVQSIISSHHNTSPIILLVAYDGCRLIGISCAVISKYLWSSLIQTEIKLIYVSPSHRGGWAFKRQLDEILRWSKEKNSQHISFSMSSGINDEKTAKCLEKRGWIRAGIDMVNVQ